MPTSIRTIARQLGVSSTTVCRALRGEGRISPALRQKIKDTAAETGYQVHPLLSQALSLSRQPIGERYRETFGLILEFPSENGPDYQKQMHEAAEARAASLACKLEPFIVSGKPAEHRRWSSIFRARGIRGLIIFPRLLNRQPRLHLEWEHFAAVEIKQTLWHPRNLHRIDNSAYLKTIEAMHLLKKVGYRRIGMAVEEIHNLQNSGVYYAPYLLMQQKLPARDRIPIFDMIAGRSEASFRKWMEKYRPDVLLVHNVVDICAWLHNMGLRVPQDISLFNTNVQKFDYPGYHSQYDWSGCRWDFPGMGQRAVDLLSRLLQNGEMGLAGNSTCWLVDEFWVGGGTLSLPIADHITPEGFLKTPASKNSLSRRPW